MNKLSSLKISVSGVRGIVGVSLTPQLIASFAAAFGSYAGRGPILVGTDTRPSRHMVTQAVFAGLPFGKWVRTDTQRPLQIA